MLHLRLITGPLLVVMLVAMMWLDARSDAWIAHLFPSIESPPRGVFLVAFLALIITPLACIELASLLRATGLRAPTGLIIVAGELGLVAGSIALANAAGAEFVSANVAAASLPAALLLMFLIALLTLTRGRRIDGVGGGIGAALVAFVALGITLAFFVALRQIHGPWLLVAIILTVKSCDIGAYFVGRTWGRKKLIPWLSPGKTWEGLIGGVVTSTVVGALLAWWSTTTDSPLPIVVGAIGGLLLGAAGQAGDLAESLLKRGANAKDSGALLPGMGGLLDVVDSLLPAGPVAAVVLMIAAAASG